MKMPGPANGNSNINGPLAPLRAPDTVRVEIVDQKALIAFLDWFCGTPAQRMTIATETLTSTEVDGDVEIIVVGTDSALPKTDHLSDCLRVMADTVEATSRNANGQEQLRTVKNKKLCMSRAALDRLLAALMERQDQRCALTHLRFDLGGAGADPNLLPSVDRIDSDGHYEAGNIQIVCRFANFWKSDQADGEFRRLLKIVREQAA